MLKAKGITLEITPEILEKMATIDEALQEIEEILDEECYKDYALHILVAATYNVIEEQNIKGGKEAIRSAVDEHCKVFKKSAKAFLKNLDQDDEE